MNSEKSNLVVLDFTEVINSPINCWATNYIWNSFKMSWPLSRPKPSPRQINPNPKNKDQWRNSKLTSNTLHSSITTFNFSLASQFLISLFLFSYFIFLISFFLFLYFSYFFIFLISLFFLFLYFSYFFIFLISLFFLFLYIIITFDQFSCLSIFNTMCQSANLLYITVDLQAIIRLVVLGFFVSSMYYQLPSPCFPQFFLFISLSYFYYYLFWISYFLFLQFVYFKCYLSFTNEV